MPDPVRIFVAGLLAGIIAALILLLFRLPWRTPASGRIAAGWSIAVALGFVVGCLVLGARFSWPPREDQDRLFLLVVPLVVVVEIAAALAPPAPRWAWLARGLVACAAMPVLLAGTVYLSDAGGEGTRLWSRGEAFANLAIPAAILATVWFALVRLSARALGVVVPALLSLSSAGAALVVMLSGYATGGQLGLPLAAALGGTFVASALLPKPAEPAGGIGVGVVATFSLLVMGVSFGELGRFQAALMLSAPLLAWVVIVPGIRHRSPALRAGLAIALVGLVVGGLVVGAQQKFARTSQGETSAPGMPEPSIDDYMNYGN